MVRSVAARQRRLQQVGGVAVPGRAAGADQRVRLVDEQDDRRRARPAPRRSPSAAAARTRPSSLAPACSRPRSSARSAHALQRRRHVAARRCRSAKPSTTAVLPTPASPVRIGLFCRRRIRMSMIWRISSSRPRTGSILPSRARCGQVGGVLRQRRSRRPARAAASGSAGGRSGRGAAFERTVAHHRRTAR